MTSSRVIVEGLVLDEQGEIQANLLGLLDECMPHLGAAMSHYLDHPALYSDERTRLTNLQERLWAILEEGGGEEGEDRGDQEGG